MGDVPLRPDGLQLDEDRRFQERFWTAERIAWGIFGLILAGALAGVTGGGGPLSNASRTVGEARVEYPAIARWTRPDTLKVGFSQGGTRSVTLGPGFLDAFQIETIQPQPSRSIATPDGLRLEFEVSGAEPEPVTFGIQALAVGRVTYGITVEGAGTGRFATLVMP